MIGARAAGLALVVVLGIASGPARAAEVTARVLPNGVRVLVREEPSAGVVAVSLQVRAGSRYETPETSGITNFLHRAMLRGAARRSAVELAEAAERIGGSLEASGDVETAEVRGTALAVHWDALLQLVAEVALKPTLPQPEIDKERRLILGQIQTRADTPFPLALDTLLADLYGASPYALPSLGRRASVEGFGREQLLAHHRAIYHPGRLVLAVSGRVRSPRVMHEAERLFGELRARGESPREPELPPTPGGGRHVVPMSAQQAHILIGYPGPALAEPDYPAVKVLAALMGGGMAGRLFVELRDHEGLAYSLGVLNPSRTGPAPFVAYLGTSRENAGAAEAGLLRELERVRTAQVSEAELDRAKTYALATLTMDRQTNARWAWYLAFFEAVGAGWDFADRNAQAIKTVTTADLSRVAQRYLTRPTVVVVEPR